MARSVFYADENNGIILDGLKVVDIECGDQSGGCKCSTTNDRNRYDKESKTIICKHYSSCLSHVLSKMQDYTLEDIKQTMLCEIKGM